MNGKKICKSLKEIRQRIADENGITLDIPECTHKGDCPGTCPRCESEVRFLESELKRQSSLGKSITLAGIAFSMASCAPFGGQVQGIVPQPNTPDPDPEIILLGGDVPYIPEEENNEGNDTSPRTKKEEEETSSVLSVMEGDIAPHSFPEEENDTSPRTEDGNAEETK